MDKKLFSIQVLLFNISYYHSSSFVRFCNNSTASGSERLQNTNSIIRRSQRQVVSSKVNSKQAQMSWPESSLAVGLIGGDNNSLGSHSGN